MNKYIVFSAFLLVCGTMSQGMFKHKKSTEHTSEQDHKTKITNLDDVKKMQDDLLVYRSKHKAFKDEPNDVRLTTGEKK